MEQLAIDPTIEPLIHRLEEPLGEVVDAVGEGAEHDLFDGRVLAAEGVEVGARDAQRLGRLQGDDGRAPPRHVRLQERDLAEVVAGHEEGEHRDLAVRRRHLHPQAP